MPFSFAPSRIEVVFCSVTTAGSGECFGSPFDTDYGQLAPPAGSSFVAVTVLLETTLWLQADGTVVRVGRP